MATAKQFFILKHRGYSKSEIGKMDSEEAYHEIAKDGYSKSNSKDRWKKIVTRIREYKLEKNDNLKTSELSETSKNDIIFIEAKDIADAENFAKTKLGIKNVSYQDLSLNEANTMNKCLHEAFNEFPELKSGIDSVGSAQYISKLNAEIGCKRYLIMLNLFIKKNMEPWTDLMKKNI